jgi:hypothetical protein
MFWNLFSSDDRVERALRQKTEVYDLCPQPKPVTWNEAVYGGANQDTGKKQPTDGKLELWVDYEPPASDTTTEDVAIVWQRQLIR